MSHVDLAEPGNQPGAAKTEKKNTSLLIRGAIWIAIGALIAAAIVCVVWVLIGDQDGLIGRAFLTILLLAGFAGIAILEAGLAPNRPDWLALSSMVSWIIALLVGAVKIWLPEEGGYFDGAERFFQLLLVVGILQLALLHVRLFTASAKRHVTSFTKAIYIATLVFLVALVGMLIFFLTFPHTFEYPELYWRIVVALTILAAVGTTLIPLLNALFAPKRPRAAYPAPASAPAWPTYADGVTPLPVLADGQPDWNAYYTGHPTVPQPGGYPAVAAPVAPSFPTTHDAAPAAPAAPTAPQSFAPQPAAPQPAAPQPAVPQPAGAPDEASSPFAPAPPAPAGTDAPPAPPVPPAPASGDQGSFPPPPPAAPAPPR